MIKKLHWILFKGIFLSFWACFFLFVSEVSALASERADYKSSNQPFANVQSGKTLTLKGVVKDESGEALIGVNIIVKGTTHGTMTNENGVFELQNVPGNATLVISYIGMKTMEVSVKGQTRLNIVMEENANRLKEVVVTTGYQDIKKSRMTGAISTISAGDIKKLNVSSMDQVFAGTVSGVSAITSGKPGSTSSIHIRGVNSLTGNSSPIWIVDGMPLQGEVPDLGTTGGQITADLFQDGIGNISIDDIASITVLKDAAASAIYGARAANGVIVVKTKSGCVGQDRFNVNIYTGLTERPANTLPMMNTDQKILFERQMFNDTGSSSFGRVSWLLSRVNGGVLSRDEAEKEIEALRVNNTDWFKALYRVGYKYQVNASMSGGSKNTQYYNSISYLNEDGTEYNNNFKRLLASTKFSHDFTKNFSVSMQLAGTYRQNKSTASIINTLEYAVFANPYETPDGDDLSYDMRLSNIRPGFAWEHINAKREILNNTNSAKYIDLSLMTKLSWKIKDNLVFNSQAIMFGSANSTRTIEGENTYTNYLNNWVKSLYPDLLANQVQGSLNEGVSTANSYNWRNTLEYNLNLNDTHYFNAFLGQEISSQVSYASGVYFPIFDQLHRIAGHPELPEGIKTTDISWSRLGNTGRFESKLSSFFLNGSYSYKDRYVLSGSVRYDGSNIIGNNNQFTPLWNVSGKWNIDNESFFNPDGFVNNLSLRAGYGYTGSIDKNAFPFVTINLANHLEYDGMIVPSSFNYSNPNVKWQTKRDFNLALDMAMFNNALTLGVNFYNNFVFDLLDNKSLAYSSGRSNVKQNVANLVNKGVEVDLSFTPIRTRDFNWNIRANFAYNRSVITQTFYKSLSEINVVARADGNSYFVQGMPVGAWIGYRFADIDPLTGHTMVYDKEGKRFDMDRLENKTLGLKAPEPEFLGNFYAPYLGGLSTSINWKRFTLSTNFEYKFGNKLRSFSTYSSFNSSNRLINDAYRWRAPGDIATYPAISTESQAFAKYMFDFQLSDGSYIRNTFTSLAYNVPNEWLESLKLSYAKVSLTVNNLFTLSSYKGIDPTLMGSFSYPNTRNYNLSLSIGF